MVSTRYPSDTGPSKEAIAYSQVYIKDQMSSKDFEAPNIKRAFQV